VILLALGGVGALASGGLAVETGEAHAYVTLGQQALAKGDHASAALSFERARLLAPRAEFVRSTLAESGLRPVGTPVARAAGWLAPREWSSLAVAFGWLAGLTLAVAIAVGLGKGSKAGRAAPRVALGSAVAFVLTIGGIVESTAASRALAVVSTPTGALISPYEAAGATADLRAGEVVVVGKRYGDFLEVRGSGGERGWVPAGTLRSVVGAGT
jgi:hypothetical protein